MGERFAATFGKARRIMQLEPYLFFYGRCEEALNFYKDVFGGEIIALNRFEGSPMESQVAPDERRNVMHATFKAPGLSFMAADGSAAGPVGEGNVSLSLATSDDAEARRVFDKLSQGGKVTMPFDNVFWGGKFGMLSDRFGVCWMVSSS